MNHNVPKWVDDLALEIRKVIQKRDAMPRFRGMVRTCFAERDVQHAKQREWEARRQEHFEEKTEQDERLKDQEAGPPKSGWKWEYYHRVLHEPSEHGWQLQVVEVEAWCPVELTSGNRPDVPQLLPPTREHALGLPEKYACLAAVHDAGRRGTEAIAPWSWSGPDKWEDRGAFEDDKNAVGFEALCSMAAGLNEQDTGWVASFIVDIENDLRRCSQRSPEQEHLESAGKRPIKTVFLSSTVLDLKDHRQAVCEVIEDLDGYHCDCMEHFGARDAEPTLFCADRVGKCDLFVGLVGHRYGSCPEGSEKSVTQLEYETAVKDGKPRLMFLAAEDLPVPADLRENDGKHQKQLAFRQQVAPDRVWDAFRHQSDLALAVVKAIRNWETQQVGHDKASAEHAEGPKVLEEPLWITSFKTLRRLLLSGAEKHPDLTHMMVQASDEQRDKLSGPPKYAAKEAVAFGGLIIQHPSIQLHDGKAVRKPGVLMSSTFYGDIEAYQNFAPIAQDAGGLLIDLPAEVLSALPVEMPSGKTGSPEHSWMLFVHRIAWVHHPGSPLKAERRIWVGNNYLPYEGKDLKTLLEMGLPEGLACQVPYPPTYFFSEIKDNAFKASVFAIDVLLDIRKHAR